VRVLVASIERSCRRQSFRLFRSTLERANIFSLFVLELLLFLFCSGVREFAAQCRKTICCCTLIHSPRRSTASPRHLLQHAIRRAESSLNDGVDLGLDLIYLRLRNEPGVKCREAHHVQNSGGLCRACCTRSIGAC
jgi:hypothetical protein